MRGHRGGAWAWCKAERRSERSAIVKLKFAGDFRNETRGDWLDLFRAGVDESVFAEQIQDAGDAARVKVHGVPSIGGKDARAVGAGGMQARLDVLVGFVERESGSLAAQRNALFDLAKFRLLEALFEFGLAGEDDLQQLFVRRLEIQKHANFFQDAIGEALRFVHDDDWGVAGAIAFPEPLVEPQQGVIFQAGVELHGKIG